MNNKLYMNNTNNTNINPSRITNSNIKSNSIILIDDITGHEWIVKISNGELVIEPTDINDIRDYKINKILK